MPPLIPRVRLRRRSTATAAGTYGGSPAYDEVMDELPEEDLADTLDLYRTGSKPEPEESEYLELLQDAVDRIAREG